METDYRVGIYARLSRDDERQGESVSIENQKLMLRGFCARQGWEVKAVFVDDGWSGTNFERPGFRELMEAVRQKEVNLVLVKDLSRLGRDYLEVGKYMDCVFPYYGCRFVALNDGVDTLRQNDEISMIFKNVINDIYARDTSKKIRAVRRANAESGKYMGYKAPYGYVKSPADKHRLIPDPEAAEVVCRIFSMRLAGHTPQSIARQLSLEGVLTPGEYTKRTKGEEVLSIRPWSRETVRSILNNEVYIGNLVQLRQGSLSYKDHRQRQKPPETWARVEGTHEGIIEWEDWAAVQKMEKGKCFRRENADLFSGLLYCMDCGKPMRRIVNRKQRKDGMRTYLYYICREHEEGSRCISQQRILEKIGEGRELPAETWKNSEKQEWADFARMLQKGRQDGLISQETYQLAAAECEEKRKRILAEEENWEKTLSWRGHIERIEVGKEHQVRILYKEECLS